MVALEPRVESLNIYSVNTSRCVMEHGRALGGRVPLGQTLEGVEQHIVGVRYLVRREVALEHTPVGAKAARCAARTAVSNGIRVITYWKVNSFQAMSRI